MCSVIAEGIAIDRQLKFLVLIFVFLGFALLLHLACDTKRQTADSKFDVALAQPTYPSNGPKVLFDEAHKNIHTSGGLYRPFAQLIKNDGYELSANDDPFSSESLRGSEILVIANALGRNDANDSSAFTDEECLAVRDWVTSGGSLLLITDHAPIGAAASAVAMQFGVEMSQGMTEDSVNFDSSTSDHSQLVFSRENGLIADHPITNGRNESERINRVMTFTGQSLICLHECTNLLKLSGSAFNRPAKMEVIKDGGDVRVVTHYGEPESASGYAQAIALKFGKGRVVVLGEAAMLTAQIDGKTKTPFGMNVPGVDNRQFALNTMHWLSHELQPDASD